VAHDRPNFDKVFKVFVVINKKLCGSFNQNLAWMVNTIGTKSTPIFHQNPRSDPKFLVGLTCHQFGVK